MNIKAKPIVDGKFWIVEEDGEKIGTLHKKENNKFMLSAKGGEKYFNRKDDLTKVFGKDFFETKVKTQVSHIEVREVYGFPTSCYPYNPDDFGPAHYSFEKTRRCALRGADHQ